MFSLTYFFLLFVTTYLFTFPHQTEKLNGENRLVRGKFKRHNQRDVMAGCGKSYSQNSLDSEQGFCVNSGVIY